MPRRWLMPWFLTLLLGFVLCWVDFSRVQAGAANVFGLAIVFMFLLAVVAVGVVRVVLTKLLRKTPVPVADSHGVNLYLASLAGMVMAAVLTVVTLSLVDKVLSSALALHAGVLVAGGLWWWLTPRLWPWPRTAHRLQAQSVFRVAGVACCAAAVAWSLMAAQTKIQSARALAQGQPYCLQASTPRGLQSVVSRLDMSGFAARAGRGGERHARMALGSGAQLAWWYWSYRGGAWEHDPLQGVLNCQPVQNSAEPLPW